MAQNSNNDVINMLESYLDSKQLFSKAASIGDNEPNGEHDASTGARSSENKKDVKSSTPNSVEDAKEGNPGVGGLKTPNLQMGMKVNETGKDVPPAPVKPHPDPGTSMPAKTTAKEASTDELIANGNELLAMIAVAAQEAEKQASFQPAQSTTKQASDSTPTTPAAEAGYRTGRQLAQQLLTKAASLNTPEAERAIGYATAQYAAEGLVGDAQEAELTKVAEEQAAYLYNRADLLATYVADYTRGYAEKKAELSKRAEGEMPPMDPSAGGAPPMDPAAGGAPAPAGAPAGGAPGGEQIPPELMQLIQQLEQAGITPEMLEEMMQQQQAGGGQPGEGAPPADMGGAGAPPEAAAAAAGAGAAEKTASLRAKNVRITKTAQVLQNIIKTTKQNRK